jgi:hypothetical protein
MPDSVSIHHPFAPKRGKQWKKKILQYIALGYGVKEAAKCAGCSDTLVYAELHRNPEFVREWHAALDSSIVLLEAEAVKRATKYSDFLLWKLLSSRQNSRYGQADAIQIDAAIPDVKLEISVRETKNEPGTQQ